MGDINTGSKTVEETKIVSIDCSLTLDVGELIASVDSVTELNTSDLVIANTSINTKILLIKKRSVPIGEAIQLSVSGGVKYKTYVIEVGYTTNSTPAQVLRGKFTLYVNP